MNKNKNIVIVFKYLTNLNTIKDNIFDLQNKLYLIPLYTWLTYYISISISNRSGSTISVHQL